MLPSQSELGMEGRAFVLPMHWLELSAQTRRSMNRNEARWECERVQYHTAALPSTIPLAALLVDWA